MNEKSKIVTNKKYTETSKAIKIPPPQKAPLVLASASPRRASILKSMGIKFSVFVSNLEEIKWENAVKTIQADRPSATNIQRYTTAKKMVLQNAELKASAIAKLHPNALVIAADTVVFCAGEVFEKPTSTEEGRRMFSLYQQNQAKVLTALHLCFPTSIKDANAVETTTINTRKYSLEENEEFFKLIFSKEKSGGFSIEGLGSLLFDNIQGSFYNVLGLPMHLLYTLASRNGYKIF